MIERKILIDLIGEGKTIWEIINELGCSRNTVRKYISLYSISTPKGFYRTGKQIGRPKGCSVSQEWRDLMSARMSGENNPFYGKTHSCESRQKMSENHADFTGDNNPLKKAILNNPEVATRLSEQAKQRWKSRDADWMRLFREKLSRNHNGGWLNKNHKNGWYYSSKCSSGFYYRSSWERKAAEYFDIIEDVFSYEYESLYIPYVDGEITRHTKSDFLITLTTGHQYLLEIKPKALIPYNQKKIDAQKQYATSRGISFYVLTENELDDIERIRKLFRETGQCYRI